MTVPERRRFPSYRAGRAATAALLCLAVVVCGVAAGLIGIAMALLLELFQWLFYGVDAATLPEHVTGAPWWRAVIAPACAGIVAGLAWWWERHSGGVVSVEQVVAESASPATFNAPGSRWRTMGIFRPFFDAVVQVLTVGGGNSVGREGAPRLAAGAVAVTYGRRAGIRSDWMGPLAAASAGAGLAAMYNAPLGGAAYAVEIVMLAGMRKRGLLLALPMSAIATIVSWWHTGNVPAISYGAADTGLLTARADAVSWIAVLCLLACVVLACAAAGYAARGLWAWLRRRKVRDSWPLPVAIGCAGLATGVLSLIVPILPGNGKDAFAAAVGTPSAISFLPLLLAVVILKPVLTGLTLAGGATGGLLAPSFSLGACAGAAIGLLAVWAGLPANIAALAVIGAGVTLAVTQRAPLFAALFVWELAKPPLWVAGVLILACWIVTHSGRINPLAHRSQRR